MDENQPGRLGAPACAVAARERCHLPWPERCGRIGWRLTAHDLLYWSGRGAALQPESGGAIPAWLDDLHGARGCALDVSASEVPPGVTVAKAVEFLVNVGLGPEPADKVSTSEIGQRLAALGDSEAIRCRVHEVIASIHDATPRRSRV